MKPQNFEERLIWYCIIGTYGFYFAGLFFVVNFTLGWILFFFLCKRLWNQTKHTPLEKRINVPWIHWLWLVCIIVIAIARFVGSINNDLDTNQTIRGIISWSTDWALIALFLLAGCLKIRPQLIYRSVCILCLQSLILIPFFYSALILHLPAHLYFSPIERLLQNGEVFYSVNLYAIEYGTNETRLFLFAPWGPALGLIGNVYFFLALAEPSKKWRGIGVVGSLAMTVVSVSRLSLIAIPIVFLIVLFLSKITKPTTQIVIGVASFLFGIFSTVILGAAREGKDKFYSARPDSSRVHHALAEIASERWKETPIWGHGAPEVPGPQIVAGMPIGSHHTWLGLLFINGLVGFTAFLVPMVLTFISLAIKAYKSATARVALSFFLILFLFTFNDSQQTLAHLYWPGLIIMAIALKGEVQNTSNRQVSNLENTYI
ncbi:O-antigen ligase [Nostoc sp. T09]|uniref:O-antigen ligase family protein n=1 Tax=Nostoc sp. T09 TaxID=1932621 RepID=UPI000A3AA641|nr:O-antigen ligase [Nostoc sp. T09]